MISKMAVSKHSFSTSLKMQFTRGGVFEDRHCTAGCLLSVLLFLPLFVRAYGPFLVFSAGLIYACLIVPLCLSYISLSAVFHVVASIYHFTYLIVVFLLEKLLTILLFVWLIHRNCQEILLQLDNVNSLTNQIVFFMLAEKLVCPEQKMTCLFTLLFFNILIYLKKALTERHWTTYLQVTDMKDFLRMTSTFIALKLAKAVVLTMVLMMLTLQFENYDPSAIYISVTAFYFILSQKGVEQALGELLLWLEMDALESLEMLWAPVIIKCTLLASSSCMIALLFSSHFWLCMFAIYTNVLIRHEELISKHYLSLQLERSVLSKYKAVSKFEMSKNCAIKDVCPVCLDTMSFARITPCNHMFHGHCLRRCLKETNRCPLCKQNI